MEKRKMKRLAAAGAAGIAMVAALGFLLGNRGLRVETVTVMKETVTDQYTEEGRISFGKEYRVIAQVSGPIGQILVEENSSVKKGDVLFTIDSTDFQYEKSLVQSTLTGLEAQLEQSRINQIMTVSPQEYLSTVEQELEVREADYQTAKTLYDGGQILYEEGSISRIEQERYEASYQAALLAWQQAKGRYEESSSFLERLKEEGIDQDTINSRFYGTEVTQLSAQIETQQIRLSQLENQIGKCQVKAECDGIVTDLPVNGMSVIQNGETGAVLGSREGAEAEADVLTSIAPYLEVGSPVEVILQLRGRDESFAGTVSQIYDYAAKGTSALGLDEYRVHVVVSLDESENVKLERLDGYGVNLKFLLYSREDCLTIPSSAVFQTDGSSYVYKIKSGRALRTPIEVAYQTGTKTVVSAGLEEKEIVIDQVDAEGIYDGAKVR